MEMIEKVARALCAANGRTPDDLEPGDVLGIDGHMRNGDPAHFLWREWSGKARTVIEAMREMTPEMRDAWQAQRNDPQYRHMMIEDVVADHWWPNAIDAALSRPIGG